jgi:Uma2 family endonuclease
MTTTRLEDFLALPDQEPGLELHPDGSVCPKMAPTSDHAELQAQIARYLLNHISANLPGVGPKPHVYTELRVNVGGASRLPDVAYYLRRPPLNDQRHALVAPDLAIEIRSPSDSVDEQRDKCRWWVAQGARITLLVDPEARAVERFDATSWRTYRSSQVVPLEQVLGVRREVFNLTVDSIFDTLDTP